MEKLIELLNQYNRDVLKWTDEWRLKNSIDNPGTKYISNSTVGAWKIYLWIISKEYGFIKWLVENDKIDRDIVDDNFTRPFYGYTNYEIVLMLLSISDTPIEDLISYLK